MTAQRGRCSLQCDCEGTTFAGRGTDLDASTLSLNQCFGDCQTQSDSGSTAGVVATVIGSLVAIGLSAAGVAITSQLLLSAAMCALSAWLGGALYAAERAARA